MKKIIAVITILMLGCMLMASCEYSTADRVEPAKKIILNKLGDENIGFRVALQTNLYNGMIKWDDTTNLVVGKKIVRFDEINTGSADMYTGITDYMERKLAERYNLTVEEFWEEYGEVVNAHFYKDCDIAVTIKYNVSYSAKEEGFKISTFIIQENEIEKIDIPYEKGSVKFHSGEEVIYRQADKIIVDSNKSIDLQTMQVRDATEAEKEEVIAAKAGNTATVNSNGMQMLSESATLKDYKELIKNGTVLNAKEIEGRLYLAVKEINDGEETLYCFIFDSASGEALYAAELTAVKGSGSTFVLAEPVMPAEKGYYEFY